MRKFKCSDCGQVFDDIMQNCPNCGCPKSACKIFYYEEPKQEVTSVLSNDAKPQKEEQTTTSSKEEHQEASKDDAKENVREDSTNLTTCCDCGGKVSLSANRCPHCGAIFHKPVDFGNAIYECFWEKYATFEGRDRRSEFWPFALLVGLLCGTLIIIKGDGQSDPHPEWIPFLITFIPMLASAIRRLHDVGRSGWWVLVPVVPLFFLFKDSDMEENKYGESPKY